MLYPEFKQYLEENTSGYHLFIEKASESEKTKNKKRQAAKRWNDEKINQTVEKYWKQASINAYNQIRAQIGVPKYDGQQIWITFIEENNFVELFDDSVAEMEFE